MPIPELLTQKGDFTHDWSVGAMAIFRQLTDRFRIADNLGAISFCLNLEFHAKIAE
jgi:hypothetical protein